LLAIAFESACLLAEAMERRANLTDKDHERRNDTRNM